MLTLACIPWAHDQGSSKRNMKVLKKKSLKFGKFQSRWENHPAIIRVSWKWQPVAEVQIYLTRTMEIYVLENV